MLCSIRPRMSKTKLSGYKRKSGCPACRWCIKSIQLEYVSLSRPRPNKSSLRTYSFDFSQLEACSYLSWAWTQSKVLSQGSFPSRFARKVRTCACKEAKHSLRNPCHCRTNSEEDGVAYISTSRETPSAYLPSPADLKDQDELLPCLHYLLGTQWPFSPIPRRSAGAFPCHPPGRALLLTSGAVHGDAGADGVAAAPAVFHPAVGDTLVLLADTRCGRSTAVSRAPPPALRRRARTDTAAPHRPGVACPHPPLPPGHPPSLPDRGARAPCAALGLPSGRGQRGAPGAGSSRPVCAPGEGGRGDGVAIWRHGAPRGAALGRAEGVPRWGSSARSGQRGADTHSSGQRRRRRAAAAGAQPRRAASWLGRAAGRGEAGGKSSGTRAERERCERGRGSAAVWAARQVPQVVVVAAPRPPGSGYTWDARGERRRLLPRPAGRALKPPPPPPPPAPGRNWMGRAGPAPGPAPRAPLLRNGEGEWRCPLFTAAVKPPHPGGGAAGWGCRGEPGDSCLRRLGESVSHRWELPGVFALLPRAGGARLGASRPHLWPSERRRDPEVPAPAWWPRALPSGQAGGVSTPLSAGWEQAGNTRTL